ncbi:NUMOD4 motif-containing protein [Vibrio phage 15E36.1]|uniref:NUMOD4 motif-containing protein n=1 Tax=Vibrio phage 15E36.1 TaxID=2859290 RepID=A0AAE7XW25_9CAUD|nr:NUMOD4 motif-containing protein [Vibrio phage 15E36.1]
MSKQLSSYIAKDIKGYEGIYAITTCGKVYSHSRVAKNGRLFKGRLLKPTPNTWGYLQIGLSDASGNRTTRTIHTLVADAFLPNHNNLPEVNHIDEDKLNNHLDNLERCTCQYNSEYTNAKTYKLLSPEGEVLTIYNLATFSDDHGLDKGAIYKVASGARKSHKGYRYIGDVINE